MADLGRLKKEDSSSWGRLLFALVVIALLAGAVGWMWLARNPEEREEWAFRLKDLSSTASDMGASLGSALSSLTDRAMGVPPRPGQDMSQTSTIPGAPPRLDQSGNLVPEGEASGSEQVAEEPDGEKPAGEKAPEENVEKTQKTPEAAENGEGGEDEVVRPAFIDDLASWLVSGYEPARNAGRKARTGRLHTSLQAANLRYGVGMKGLSWIGDDLPAGRAAALKYVFTPSMLDSIYRLYIDRFMDAMEDYAFAPVGQDPHASEEDLLDADLLDAAERAEMFRLYAQRFRALSGAVQGVVTLTDFAERMQRVRTSAQDVVDASARYTGLVAAQDEARDLGDDARLRALSPQVARASRAYQQALVNREKTRSALAAAIRANENARALGNPDILYIAAWIDRRLRQSPDQALEAALQAATLFLDLAGRFENAAEAQVD